MGTYNDLLASSSLFCDLLDNIHQHEQDHSVDVPNENEQETPVDLFQLQSVINSPIFDKEDKKLVPSSNVETKQEGRLKWNVYVSYLRAGAGIVIGFILVSLVSGIQQFAYILSNWWLAAWNDDETYRHQIFTNCTINQQNNTIWSLTDEQWNNYRNRRFYIYCGL